MADKNAKAQKSVAGKYFVDTNCVSCGQCVDIAGDFFMDDSDAGGIYVKAQPSKDDDISLCEQALSACPVDAIGNDGE